MKKLYAIRNKETGEIYRHTFVPIHATREGAEIDIREELNSEKYEPVTLRIEPTEPCEWCGVNDGAWCETYHGRMVAIDNEGYPETLLAENWTFCPNCGRRLE